MEQKKSSSTCVISFWIDFLNDDDDVAPTTVAVRIHVLPVLCLLAFDVHVVDLCPSELKKQHICLGKASSLKE